MILWLKPRNFNVAYLNPLNCKENLFAIRCQQINRFRKFNPSLLDFIFFVILQKHLFYSCVRHLLLPLLFLIFIQNVYCVYCYKYLYIQIVEESNFVLVIYSIISVGELFFVHTIFITKRIKHPVFDQLILFA